MNKKIALFFQIALVALPLLSFAQAGLPSNQTGINSVNDVYNLVTKIVTWMLVFFYVVAVIFIILAAFQYLTAAGNEDAVKEAKTKLIYALIAIAIALVSTGVKTFVLNALTQGAPQP